MAAGSRTAEVYEALKDELLNGVDAAGGKWTPGGKIAIDQLAERFRVSLGVVREALARLTSDRLVTAAPQRGFAVAPLSRADLIDLNAVRIEIETRCLRRSIQCGSLEWEGRLLDAWHQLSRTQRGAGDESGVNPDWTRLHGGFHDGLIAACDSPWWLRLRDELHLQVERYRRMARPQAPGARKFDDEHFALLDAALKRDADRACTLLAGHLQRTADALLAEGGALSELEDPGAVAPASPRRRVAHK